MLIHKYLKRLPRKTVVFGALLTNIVLLQLMGRLWSGHRLTIMSLQLGIALMSYYWNQKTVSTLLQEKLVVPVYSLLSNLKNGLLAVINPSNNLAPKEK